MPADLDHWLDSARIVAIVDSYFRALDERQFDAAHFRDIFAPDANMVRPNGAATAGADAIAHSHAESFARFESTQHLLTGHHVTIDSDTAAVRANLVAIHLWKDKPADASMLERSFTAGGVLTAQLSRTADGWRITQVENRILWRTGDFGTMLQTR